MHFSTKDPNLKKKCSYCGGGGWRVGVGGGSVSKFLYLRIQISFFWGGGARGRRLE